MLRRVSKLFALLVVLGLIVGAIWFARSADPRYDATELVFADRYHRYDTLITETARSRELDPMLVKALIWRESRFHPHKIGTSGERGLMQVGEAAASDWAKVERANKFTPDDLLDPETNVRAGTWLLARALRGWQQNTDDAIPFALAEYNAGRSRVLRWVGGGSEKERAAARFNSADLPGQIKIASTRQYVENVVDRLHFYQKRGRL